MVTVGDVFELAIEIDMTKIAHRTFWALSKGHVTANCPADKLHEIDYHAEEIESMINSNLLNIEKVKVFVVQTNYPNTYAFYFAENSLDAYALHQQRFREKPKKITMASELLIKLFEFSPGTSSILSTVRKKTVEFPSYLGHANAREHILYKIESA